MQSAQAQQMINSSSANNNVTPASSTQVAQTPTTQPTTSNQSAPSTTSNQPATSTTKQSNSKKSKLSYQPISTTQASIQRPTRSKLSDTNNPTHAYISWIGENKTSVIRTEMFVGVRAIEIVEGQRYEVLFKEHKGKAPVTYPALVIALGNKSSCDELEKLHSQNASNQSKESIKAKSPVVFDNKENIAELKRENQMLKRKLKDLEETKDRTNAANESLRQDLDKERESNFRD